MLTAQRLVRLKDNLFEFLNQEAAIERPSEVFGERAIVQLLDQFFQCAVYYAVVGYERGHAAA